MLFVDVKVKKRMDCASDKVEEDGEMEDDRSNYRVFMHGFMSTTLNVLSTLWTLVWASFFFIVFPSSSNNFSFQIFGNTSINLFVKPT